MEETFHSDNQVRIYQVHFQIDCILTLLGKKQHHQLANLDTKLLQTGIQILKG